MIGVRRGRCAWSLLIASLSLAPHSAGAARNEWDPSSNAITEPDTITLIAPGWARRGLPYSSPALARIHDLLGQNHIDQAERFGRTLLARFQREGVADSLLLAETLALVVESIRIGTHPSDSSGLPFAAQALGILRRHVGEDHERYAYGLRRLSNLVKKQGDYDRAFELQQRALEIASRHLPPTSQELVPYISSLASTQLDRNDIIAGAAGFRRVIWIREHAADCDSAQLGGDYHNYAVTLQDMGDLRAAREGYERAVSLREQFRGAQHPEFAASLCGLAGVDVALGHNAEAVSLYERALSIYEARLGTDHPDTWRTVGNLALACEGAGDYEGAHRRYSQAIDSHSQSLGPTHPLVATEMTALARVLEKLGETARAESLLADAYRMRLTRLGEWNLEVAESRCEMARFAVVQGRPREALELALLAESSTREQYVQTASALSMRRALMYGAVRATGLDVLLSAAIATPRLSADSLHPVWDAVVRSRHLAFDALTARRESNRLAGSEESRRLVHRARELADSLARRFVIGCPPATSTDCDARTRALLDEREEVEGALAATNAVFRSERRGRDAGSEDALASLPPAGALLAYVRYRDVRHGKGERYLAFLSAPGITATSLVDLGSATEIDSLVSRWSTRIVLGTPGPWKAQAERACRDAGAALRVRIWNPVASMFRGASRLFVVPDGALATIDFDALPVAAGGFLVESGPIIQCLTGESDLLPRAGPLRNGLLAMGAPAYDASLPRIYGESSPIAFRDSEPVPSTFRGTRSACSEFRDMRFEPLPGAAREIREIASLWSSSRGDSSGEPLIEILGQDASETAFKRTAPRVGTIHLATHGFYLGGSCASLGKDIRRTPVPRLSEEDLVGENPLLLTGLAFAGGNQRESAAAGQDDGVLTGEEVEAMDLQGVEWVVLSACESGQGPLATREGLLGLPRAFLAAGARTVITSLWPVDDKAALNWMRSLYRCRLLDRMDTALSVRSAKLQALRECRSRGASTHPLHWAGFVAAGDWN